MRKDKKIKTLRGTVVSDKMQKTVVVAVTLLKRHPKYGKQYKVTSRYKAHDEKGEFHVGDKVRIGEIRPMSKEKCWRVVAKI
jgi:small subunit ribosomal protein S17